MIIRDIVRAIKLRFAFNQIVCGIKNHKNAYFHIDNLSVSYYSTLMQNDEEYDNQRSYNNYIEFYLDDIEEVAHFSLIFLEHGVECGYIYLPRTLKCTIAHKALKHCLAYITKQNFDITI